MNMQQSFVVRVLSSTRFWTIGYLSMVVGIVVGFYQFRSWSDRVYANSEAQTEWEEWRSDVEAQPAEAPVKRRVPKSIRPPATVLLTDYFTTCMSIAIVLSTALFITFMIITRGAIQSPGVIESVPD